MCDACVFGKEQDDKVQGLYEQYLKESGDVEGKMLGAMYETGSIRIPEVGILFLQKGTDRSTLDEEGATPLPDSPVQGLLIHEDEMMAFISGIFVQMGPEFMFKLIGKDYPGDDS